MTDLLSVLLFEPEPVQFALVVNPGLFSLRTCRLDTDHSPHSTSQSGHQNRIRRPFVLLFLPYLSRPIISTRVSFAIALRTLVHKPPGPLHAVLC